MVVLWTVESTTNVESSEDFTFPSCLQRAPPLLGEDVRSGSPLLKIRSQVGEASMKTTMMKNPPALSNLPHSLWCGRKTSSSHHVSCLHRAPPFVREEARSGSLVVARGALILLQVKKEKFVESRLGCQLVVCRRSLLAMYMVGDVLSSTPSTFPKPTLAVAGGAVE